MRRMQATKIRRRTAGITLVELGLVLTIIPLVLAGLIATLTIVLNESRDSSLRSTYESRLALALDDLERDLRYSASFNAAISAPFTDPYAPSGGWNYSGTSADNRVLILSTPGTTLKQGATSRIPAYEDSPKFTCAADELAYNPILMYRSVFFVDGGTLYKRVLSDLTTPRCNDPIQKQSCPVASKASWPTICKARDEVIATDISQFSVDYYAAGKTSPMVNQYSDPDEILNAESVRITITMQQPNSTDPVKSTLQLKTAKVN